MNREQVAKELLKVAKDLTAASDIDLGPEYRKMFAKVAKKLESAIKGIKGVDKTDLNLDNIGSGIIHFSIGADGYTQGDLEANARVYVSIDMRDGKNLTFVEGKRPDWGKYSTKIFDENFTTVVPLGGIVRNVELVFG